MLTHINICGECAFKENRTDLKLMIRCECGEAIPFISDLPAMRKAIDLHAQTHRKIAEDCSKTQAENEGEAELDVERIKGELIKKALEKVKEIKNRQIAL